MASADRRRHSHINKYYRKSILDKEELFTNEFKVLYDEERKRLCVYRIQEGKEMDFPIEIKLSTLMEMSSYDASKWVGETLLLLIPEMRKKIFRI